MVVDVPLTDAETLYQFDHGHLRTVELPGSLVSRDPAGGRSDTPSAAIPNTASFAGSTTDGDVVTADSPGAATAVLRFWESTDLHPTGELRIPGDVGNRAIVSGSRRDMDERRPRVDPGRRRGSACRPLRGAGPALHRRRAGPAAPGTNSSAPCDDG